MTTEQKLKLTIEALERIEGQAVCVGMDGEEGNVRMLRHIADLAHKVLKDVGP